MYAENWLMFPYFQSFPQDLEQFQDLYCCSPKPNASMSNFSQSSTISDYDLGGEGDLFKAPEPIIEESVMSLDPMMAAIPMISCGEEIISSQDLKVCATESSLENEQLLFEIFYECEKDLLAKEATETQLSEVLDFKIPFIKTDESLTEEHKVISHGQFQKSSSSGNLGSMVQMHGAPLTTNFLDFTEVDLGTAYGMRRAFSEGDIKALGNGNISLVQSPLGQPQVSSIFATEDRKEKLSRYRNKKSKRNFGRKIKYACRKALADSQPRIRGRFAKTEDIDISKKQ